MEYSAKTRLPLNSDGIIYLFAVVPPHSPNWHNPSLIFPLPMGENIKGLSKSPFLAINAKGGESIKPKAKGLHHHNFKKFEMKF
jgi:hypothetical protein